MKNRAVLGGLLMAAAMAMLPVWAHEDHGGADLDVIADSNSGEPSFAPFEASGVQLLSWLNLAALGKDPEVGEIANGSDCWGYTSPGGREYALMNHSLGTAVVDITDPVSPVIIDTVLGPESLWRDVMTYGEYAYMVSEGGDGIQVVDLSEVDDGVVTHLRNITTSGSTATHTVEVNATSGFLYRCGGSGNGLRIYDLADPENPEYVTSWSDRYVHDAYIVTYESGPYEGLEIAFCCAGTSSGWVDPGITILDVTDKTAIEELAHLEYSGAVYAHQCWLTEDQQYLLVNDELDEVSYGTECKTIVIDVSDLEAPFLETTFSNGLSATDHNLFVLGDRVFEANYKSGLRIFDIADPKNASEVAFFDTWPQDDSSGYASLWNVYPYFPSGTVIGSDLEKGLFVWRIGDPPLEFAYPQFPTGIPEALGPDFGELEVEITALDGFEVDPDRVTLHYRLDDGETLELAMTLSDTGSFIADPPELECGDHFDFFIRAYTTDGTPSVDPLHAPHWRHHTSVAVETAEPFEDDMEEALGWDASDPDDDATAGLWTRGDPNGTGAQPEDDTTADGTLCWFTGQGSPGGGLGEADVDAGRVTLTSPRIDLVGFAHVSIAYSRWFSNDTGSSPGLDVLLVEISGDDGDTWVEVETVGPTGPEAEGGWYVHEFHPLELIEPSSEVRLRFIASDVGGGSVVEAAIDDFHVHSADCGDDCDGNARVDAEEIALDPFLDCDGNLRLDVCDLADGTLVDGDGDGLPDGCECLDPFVRGDFDGDASLSLEDGILLLTYLFSSGGPPAVEASTDVNGDDALDISDPIYLLRYMYSGGAAPPAPFPEPGCE